MEDLYIYLFQPWATVHFTGGIVWRGLVVYVNPMHFYFAVKIETSEFISCKYRRCLDTILQTVTWKLPRIFFVLRGFLFPVAMDICSYCSVSLFYLFIYFLENADKCLFVINENNKKKWQERNLLTLDALIITPHWF